MNFAAVFHQPKSNYAFAIDESTIRIVLRCAKNDLQKVELIIGDPFDYKKINADAYIWEPRTKPFIKLEKKYETKVFDYFVCYAKSITARCKYAFLLYTESDVYLYNTSGVVFLSKLDEFKVDNDVSKIHGYQNKNILFDLTEYFNFPYINYEDIYKAPDWTKDTIWYQIFPDRFYPGDNPKENKLAFGSVVEGINNRMTFGGSLQGVIDKIPYLVDLGITGIYFTPIFESPSAHKYDTTNYLLIEPQFGTNDDFKKLVDELHKNGIKIILDAVFNHCGWHHPYFQDAIKNGKKSKYYDCFFFDGTEGTNFAIKDGLPFISEPNFKPNYRTFAFTPYMPKLNTTNPIMEKYLLDVTRYWMENYHIDGWRLDVSNEVSHLFWAKFREVVKGINPNAYILGENWDDSNPWLRGDELDAVMNYNLALPIWRFFGTSPYDFKIDAETFKDYINRLMVLYPENVMEHMFNLIDSHDTMRILRRCGDNKDLFKLAYLFLFSFPGSPNIYYGDEVGLTGDNDPDNRRCMIWEVEKQDTDLLAWMKELISNRKLYKDFSSVDFVWHYASDNVIIYQKNSLVFILNNNNTPKNIKLPTILTNRTVYSLTCGMEKHLKENFIVGSYKYFIFDISE